MNVQKCPRCELMNAVDTKNCSRCGGVLDLRYAMELEEKQRQALEIREQADNLMSRLMKDPDVQKVIMEKLKGMV